TEAEEGGNGSSPWQGAPPHLSRIIGPSALCNLIAERRANVVGGKLHLFRIAWRQALWQGGSALTHVHDLGARKTRENGLHQRIRLYAGLERGLPCLNLRSDRRLAFSGGDDDYPAPVGPLRELARKIVDQRVGSGRLQGDLESPILAAHQPHVALERKLDGEVALLGGKDDQILEKRNGKRQRARLRLRRTRDRLVRWRERSASHPARGIDPRR